MALTLEPAFTLTVDCAEPREVGKTHAGLRRVVPILGGTVSGPALTGEVLPCGADWNVVRPDGAVHVWARYEIRSAEGAVISVINEGLGFFDATTTVFSMPTRPVFEVPEGGPTWLATGFFLGELRLDGDPGQVIIEVSRVRPT